MSDEAVNAQTAAKRPRLNAYPEADQQHEVEELDEELASPASRWQASPELTALIESFRKPLQPFDRKSICRKFSRPDVEAAYTPALDNYLCSLVSGVKQADKDSRFLQDRMLGILGPMSFAYEHLNLILHQCEEESSVALTQEQVKGLFNAIYNSMALVGNASALLSKERRSLVLKKINSKGTLVSLAAEEFPDAKKNLFSDGFEERWKTRSETAKTLFQAANVGKRDSSYNLSRRHADHGRDPRVGQLSCSYNSEPSRKLGFHYKLPEINSNTINNNRISGISCRLKNIDFISSKRKDKVQVFDNLNQVWGPLEVDLFATRLSKQLPRFVSWRPDPEAESVNAWAQDWGNFRGYAFLPFSLVGRCLKQVLTQNVPTLVLIAPVWRTQPWYPLLLELSIAPPRLLPPIPGLLTKIQEVHPLTNLQLAGWLVSADHTRQQVFQNQLKTCFSQHGERILPILIPQLSGNRPAGVVNKKLIQFVQILPPS